MGSSAKKKREKKSDFKKTKLKVGKARPKNTNATDTSFAAKSIVLKQQSLSESGRDPSTIFNHNLSLLASKADTQRRDALAWLTNAIPATADLPQPASAILSKTQPLILDGTASVRSQLLKLLRVLPYNQLGPLDQMLLYTRAGMSHLSGDIKLSSLDVLDWLIEAQAESVVSCAGGWVKTLETFQTLLSWDAQGAGSLTGDGKWTTTKPTTSLGSSELLVHQLNTLTTFLNAGLAKPVRNEDLLAIRAAQVYPLTHFDAHLMPTKSNPYGYLNLFGKPRDSESEMYEDPEERQEALVASGMYRAFVQGVAEARKEGGEVRRAAASVTKALQLVVDVG
ncbi:rRNA processing protein [Oleoguttula sp. CCFEE 5521]